MTQKEKQNNFIKEFSKISISKICKENKIDNTSISKCKASDEKTEKVYNELKNKLIKLLLNEV